MRYRGNKPELSDGWVQMDSYFDSDGVEWLIYQQPQNTNNVWLNYKIVANGFAEYKANYWFAFNQEEERFAFKRDLISMGAKRPELYKFVSDFVAG